MLLLPMRVALVSAGTIPITIFISLGLFMACGLELNCITLCVLILSLGMVVDNCIVIIDSYLEKLGLLPQDLPREEYDRLRREASIDSARHFFRSIFSATLAISVTFFPILFTVTGMPLDFLEPGKRYRAMIYEDGPGADYRDNPMSLAIRQVEVTAADTLTLHLARSGGTAIRLIPVP